MKNSDIYKTILSEASGRPLEEIDKMFEAFTKSFGTFNFDKELPEEEAQKLLAQLRKELPGISAWLIEGGFLANPSRVKGSA